MRKLDDLAKTFKPQSEEEHEFYYQVLDSVCARFGKDPNNLQDFPLNVAIWSQFTSDCLWASSWLTKDHEDFKTMAMKKNFSRTQHVIQSVHGQVKTLIEICKYCRTGIVQNSQSNTVKVMRA